MMSDADLAYAAAVAEIERVHRATQTRKTWLDLWRGGRFRDLDRIPPEIVNLTGLHSLDLRGTQVSDITILKGLKKLHNLSLVQTKVVDLRPICELALQHRGANWGLEFWNTPAVLLDPILAKLAQLDQPERTVKTLEYLRSLPKYPAPLPWLKGDGEAIPAGRPAPLQVIEQDGKLVALRGATSLPDASDLLAAQAWAALRNFLDDMADQRGRVHNSMPSLARALARFEDALAVRYDLCDAIALGIHGGRVIALAPSANESLSKADTAEVTQLAAAIALFLERFPAWRAYRDDANPTVFKEKEIQDVVPLVRALGRDLQDRPEIDAEIPKQLEALTSAALDAPNDRLAARGLLDSLGNVIAALASRSLMVLRKGTVQGGKLVWNGTKIFVGKGTDAALNVAATDFLFNNSANLTKLAEKLPAIFEWLAKFLQSFPLA